VILEASLRTAPAAFPDRLFTLAHTEGQANIDFYGINDIYDFYEIYAF